MQQILGSNFPHQWVAHSHRNQFAPDGGMERFEKALTSIADRHLHYFSIGTCVTNAFCRGLIGFERRKTSFERIDGNNYFHFLILGKLTFRPHPSVCDSRR